MLSAHQFSETNDRFVTVAKYKDRLGSSGRYLFCKKEGRRTNNFFYLIQAARWETVVPAGKTWVQQLPRAR